MLIEMELKLSENNYTLLSYKIVDRERINNHVILHELFNVYGFFKVDTTGDIRKYLFNTDFGSMTLYNIHQTLHDFGKIIKRNEAINKIIELT